MNKDSARIKGVRCSLLLCDCLTDSAEPFPCHVCGAILHHCLQRNCQRKMCEVPIGPLPANVESITFWHDMCSITKSLPNGHESRYKAPPYLSASTSTPVYTSHSIARTQAVHPPDNAFRPIFEAEPAVLGNSTGPYRTFFEITRSVGSTRPHIAYELLLEPHRHRTLKILELGLDCDTTRGLGPSVALWQEYAPRSEFHGAVRDPQCARKWQHVLHSRLHAWEPSSNFSALQEQLRAFATQTGGGFDVIVDRDWHRSANPVSTMVAVFQTLLSHGGTYALEGLGQQSGRGPSAGAQSDTNTATAGQPETPPTWPPPQPRHCTTGDNECELQRTLRGWVHFLVSSSVPDRWDEIKNLGVALCPTSVVAIGCHAGLCTLRKRLPVNVQSEYHRLPEGCCWTPKTKKKKKHN